MTSTATVLAGQMPESHSLVKKTQQLFADRL